MEFYFGDKTFHFPLNSLHYYPWFKNTLESNEKINLTDYLLDVSNENKRNIEKSLKELEKYYNNNDYFIISDTNLIMTESFLSKGPYSTKGLDLDYNCTKCQAKTLLIQYNINYHRLEQFNENSKICIICGVVFNNESKNITYCIQDNKCIHNWV